MSLSLQDRQVPVFVTSDKIEIGILGNFIPHWKFDIFPGLKTYFEEIGRDSNELIG